ncbi:MAG: helix-turn-helix transcriptional regulator [Armatimonadota bacterium]
MQKSIHTDQQQVFQEMLRQARQKAGLTQKELASKLGTPHTRISDYERGERRMDLVQLMRYCKALGTDLRTFVDQFLERSSSNP